MRQLLYRAAFLAALVPSLISVCSAQTNGPCDIFASATPCVAAYSTTRALFKAYTGNLYQVTRQSDNTTTNIAVLTDGSGYAAAATQDAFCANTTCTITKLYDQTSEHNNLTLAPPGGEASGPGPGGYDVAASATALPVIAGGHKVYGLLVSSGVGYRNDATTGIATNGAPEGVYMVSSTVGLSPQGACCFDFGNAETTNTDPGSGYMDAMNLHCVSTSWNVPCTPMADVDLENGTYGNVTGTTGTRFLTAMAWNDGQHYFEVYLGNAQSGGLSSSGSTALPSGYSPMRQEGAIVLGVGGDNSDSGTGFFFEGVMTAGAPSSTVMSNVQSDIVSVNYQGAPTLSDGVTYTFTNQSSQMNLDNYCDGCSGAPTNGVQVIQYPANGLETQEWTLHTQGNGYFTMVNVQSGFCLDDPWGNGTPSRTLPQAVGTSTMLWQQPCNGNEAQNWEFIPQSNSSFVIENEAATVFNPRAGTPMVIDDYEAEATSGLQMWLDTANGLAPQNWVAANTSGTPSGTIADGATYTLENQASQMLLDNYCDGCSGGATDGVQVIEYPANGWATQKWTFHNQGSGYYTMVNVQSGFCLDDPWGNGTPSRTLPQVAGTSTMLWQQPCNGNAAQDWKFIPQSNGYFVVENKAATTNHGSAMVIDDYEGEATSGLQMWLNAANGQTPQNWLLNIQ